MDPDESRAGVIQQLAAALGPDYEVERELGAGGFAVVFLVRDLRLKRPLAVKVLRPELIASKAAVDRSHLEAQTIAQLSHPNIVPLHFVGGEGEFFYLVMTYVEGESLADRIAREGKLSVAETQRVLREIADALAFAHRHGVVHRDVKPDNVLLEGETGRALLTDFGIARSSLSAAKITSTGLAIGTPAYMSPEQLAGDTVDGRTDLYSLGVMGYQMLSGTVPFAEGTPMTIMAKRLSESPEPISSRRIDLPQDLADLIMRCLAIEPIDRFESAGEVVRLLDQSMRAPATPTPGISISAPARKRRSLYWTVGGAVGIAAVAVAFWVLGGLPHEGTTQEPAIAPAHTDPMTPPGMALIPAGSYPVGRNDGHEWSRPAHTVELARFAIGVTEVTVGEYAEFIAATGAQTPWDTKPDDRMPVSRVTWSEATGYCAWRYEGGRLPTEEEWEAAARGATGLRYPWGDEPVPGRANTATAKRGGPMPVGSFAAGASSAGVQDLIGNLWEWTSSPMDAYPGGVTAPRSAGTYVIRGGAFETPDSIADATRRGYLPPSTSRRADFAATGFRCAIPLAD